MLAKVIISVKIIEKLTGVHVDADHELRGNVLLS